MNPSLVMGFIFFLFVIPNGYSQAPPTPEEIKKIDKIVQDTDKLWDEVATEFAKKNGIPRSELPKKLPTQFENAVRTQHRETLYKVINGELDWSEKFREAFLNFLEFSVKEGKSLVPDDVYKLDHEKEPPFNAKHLKLFDLGQKVWDEFRLKFIEINNLEPDALPQKTPRYYRVMISRLSDEEIEQKEKEWDTKTKDQVLEVFLQYSEFNFPNKGITSRGEIDAKTFLDGKKNPDLNVKEIADEVPSKMINKEELSFKDKYLKFTPFVIAGIMILFFLLK